MDIKQLESYTRTLCGMTTDQVFAFLGECGFTVFYPTSQTKRYAVLQGTNKQRPLLVCHADTVRNNRDYLYNESSGLVVSSELDDRLGIAIVLCLIADGIDCSVLICDNEETGQTTARQFAKESNLLPNWMTEFDRRGTDVVCYDYETPILVSMLEHIGFKVGQGSFSDISSMESMEVIGFNVGVGYHKEHSLQCHANLNDTMAQVERWLLWYHWLNNVRLAHEERTWKRKSRWNDWSFLADDHYPTAKHTEAIPALPYDNPRMDDVDDFLGDDPDFELCDNCDCYFDAQTAHDYNGGKVCENCIVDLRGVKT